MSMDASSSVIVGVKEGDVGRDIEEIDLTGTDIEVYTSGNLCTGDGLTRMLGIYVAYGDLYDPVEIPVQKVLDTVEKAKDQFGKIGVSVMPKIYLISNYG